MKIAALVIATSLAPLGALAAQNSDNWLAGKSTHLSQQWSEYQNRREQKKFDLQVCRQKATSERIALNLRADFVRVCVRERHKFQSHT